MSRNPHRIHWIGRDGTPGRWCHAPGCHEYAPTIRAQMTHADVHEPGVTMPTEGAPLDEETA